MTRRRFLYTRGGEPLPEPVEVSADFQATPDRMPLFTDRFREGDRAPDGTDIGSRRKVEDWKRATGSTEASDYSRGFWEKKAQERATPAPGVREALRDAVKRLKGY